jgi:hypothetical protein
MKHQRPLPPKQLKAFYQALCDADRTMAYTADQMRFLQQRRDAFLQELKK